MNRLEQVNSQFTTSKQFVSKETHNFKEKVYPEVVDNHVSRGTKLDYFKKQGWGYNDSHFVYDEKSDGVKFVGSRYMLDNKLLPAFKPWIETNVGIDFKIKEDPQADMECPAPIVNT